MHDALPVCGWRTELSGVAPVSSRTRPWTTRAAGRLNAIELRCVARVPVTRISSPPSTAAAGSPSISADASCAHTGMAANSAADASRAARVGRTDDDFISLRSEEHTSELQSLMRISYAVFCLKKKKTNTKPPEQTDTN